MIITKSWTNQRLNLSNLVISFLYLIALSLFTPSVQKDFFENIDERNDFLILANNNYKKYIDSSAYQTIQTFREFANESSHPPPVANIEPQKESCEIGDNNNLYLVKDAECRAKKMTL